MKITGVCRSARMRLTFGSLRKRSIRNSTNSAPASAAAFHSAFKVLCLPRPIVTQIMERSLNAEGPSNL